MLTIFEAVDELAAAVNDTDYAAVDLNVRDPEPLKKLFAEDPKAISSTRLVVDFDGARVIETVRGTMGKLRVTLSATRKATPEDLIEHAEKMRAERAAASTGTATVVPMTRSAS